MFDNTPFTGASGARLPWKIECDDLAWSDWLWAAARIAERVQFGEALGVPRGGAKLAQALQQYSDGKSGLLIVDDVLTTGGSIERFRNGREAMGFVVFARGKLPPWVRALWHFDQCTVIAGKLTPSPNPTPQHVGG